MLRFNPKNLVGRWSLYAAARRRRKPQARQPSRPPSAPEPPTVPMNTEADPTRPPWIEGALAEYEAHRAEVLAEAAAQGQHLAFGATAVGVVVAGAFNVWDERLLATIAFLVVVPLLSAFVLVQWAGSAAAKMRVGVYLERIETTIGLATSAPAPVLTWEATLARMRPDRLWKPQAGWSDFGAVAIFALLAGGSLALGAYRGWSGYEAVVGLVTAIESVILILIVVAIACGVATVRQEARKSFPEPDVDPEVRCAGDA